jgi:hypothetical protein
LEKERDKERRHKNVTTFAYIDKESSVEELLNIILQPNAYTEKFVISVVDQSKLPRNEKWIKVLFNTKSVENVLLKSPCIVQMNELFTPIRGTFRWTIDTAGAGLGADKFFYLTQEDVEKWNLQGYVHPALVSQRYAKNFIFRKKDWQVLKKKGKPCYVFLCQKPWDQLPENVKKYIEWGENTPLTKPKK